MKGDKMSFKEVREKSGMNKTEFAKYFEIPYRTVQNWELETRKCPDYLLKLIKYKLEREHNDYYNKIRQLRILLLFVYIVQHKQYKMLKFV